MTGRERILDESGSTMRDIRTSIELSHKALGQIGEGDWTPQDSAHLHLLTMLEKFLVSVDSLVAERDGLREDYDARCQERDSAEREAQYQMRQKLEAQSTLNGVTQALDLPLADLGNGWREALPKILARIEMIVDEGERGFRERDEVRDALTMLRSAWNAHMETCPQHAALPDLPAPTWEELERWRNAPSGTAAGGVLQPNEALPDEARAGLNDPAMGKPHKLTREQIEEITDGD